MDKKEQQQNQTQENSDSQIKEDLRSNIISLRDYYSSEIKRIEEIYEIDKIFVNSFEFDPEKKGNAKICLRKMKKYLKEIKEADSEVQKNVNLLLDFKAHGEFEEKMRQDSEPKNELVEKMLQDFKVQRDTIQNNNLFNSCPIEIIGFPRKHKKLESLFAESEVSAFYQFYVYQLVCSLLVLHNKMASFTFYRYDVIWILETNQEKKITFLTHLIQPQLSRKDCFECIEKVLKNNKLCVPEWSIKKQLSSWNKYLSTQGKRGTEPIMLYDVFRERSKELFEQWVVYRYLPEFKKQHHRRSVDPKKEFHGKNALEWAENEHPVDTMDEIYNNLDKPEKIDILDAISQKGHPLPDDATLSFIIDNDIIDEKIHDSYVKNRKRHKKR
jgi:hypothetical protein